MIGLAVLVNQGGSFAAGEVAEARFHYRSFIVADGPGGPLRFGISSALNRLRAVSHFVGKVASQHTLLIDGKLKP